MPQWVFYLMAMLFDAVTCIISTFYLIRSASGINRFVDSIHLRKEDECSLPPPFVQYVLYGQDVRGRLADSRD